MTRPFSLTLLFFLLQLSEALAGPPLRRWYTIQTACCDITYHDGLDEEAQHFAKAAQESHQAAGELLGYAPTERTQLLLTDDTDGSNASAIPVPYNQIRAFARAPSSFSDLSDYDDWARALILHEYTHIIHTDRIRGIPEAINWVFGKVYPPNLLLPRWFVEGLAVFSETRLTTSGRAQSSIFNMYLRTAALNGKLWDLDVLTSGTRSFPGGNGPYLYGGHFLSWLADHHGQKAFADIIAKQGGAIFPWAPNWLSQSAYSADFGVLYEQWRYDLTKQALEVQRRVESQGITQARRLTGLGQTVMFPRMLRDGRLAFYAAPIDDTPGLYTLQAQIGHPPSLTRLTEVQGVQGLSPTPDGQSIIFSQPEVHANTYSYQDLWRADLKTGESKRLTAGARLRDPDVHPDGRTAMAVENRVGASRLALVDLSTGAIRPVFSFQDGSEIHSPRFSPKGDSVVFTAWRPGGFRDVFLLAAGHSEPQRLTHDRAIDMHPSFTPDGRAIYFTSDRDGIFNVYRMDLATTEVRRATNVITGAFMPIPMESEGALLYVGFHPDGYDLFAQPLEAQSLPRAPVSRPRPIAKQLPTVPVSAPRPYLPFETLAPHTWQPTILGSTIGGLDLGAKIGGEDLVGYHAYALEAHAYLPKVDYAWGASYQFTGLPFSIYTAATGYLARSLITVQEQPPQERTEHMLRAEMAFGLPLYRWRYGHSLNVGYSFELPLLHETPKFVPDDPAPRLPMVSPLGWLTMAWVYSDQRSVRDSVSVEQGRRVSLRLRVSHPALLSTATLMEFTGDYHHFVPVPGLPRHVWVIALQAGIARGDPDRRRFFVLGGSGMPEPSAMMTPAPLPSLGSLRGYPPVSFWGHGYLLSNLEWRFPITDIHQGLFTLPLFAQRLRGAVFLDQGLVFEDAPMASTLKRGVGAEITLDTVVFYQLPFSLRLGIARGLDQGGLDTQMYAAAGLGG